MEEVYADRRVLLLNGPYIIDATQALPGHPGGANAIRKRRGCDISRDIAFHSRATQDGIRRHVVGYLV